MNDDELKKLFKSQDYGRPPEIEMARWKKIVARELDRTPSEWMRLAVACAIGVVIGATAFKSGEKHETARNYDSDESVATVERVHVNLE
ncbi:MAG: hypothetical protein AAB250_06955 [Bdellovibrionota bacterium]